MPDLTHFAIPAFIILIMVEIIVTTIMKAELYDVRDTVASLSMGIGNVIVNIGGKAVLYMMYVFLYQYAVFDIGSHWWSWLLLLFADDLTYYVWHRVSHNSRLFWASHVNHHSSQKFNLSTALRIPWTDVFYGFIFWLWLPLAGFSPMMVMTMQALSLVYQFWIHTELLGKLGPLEGIFNTPSHHRVHHATNTQYLDRNYGAIFIIWDRLFGTFAREDEKPIYGLTRNIHTYNLINIWFHEWQALWRDFRQPNPLLIKLCYIFRAPGWKPDRTGKTIGQ